MQVARALWNAQRDRSKDSIFFRLAVSVHGVQDGMGAELGKYGKSVELALGFPKILKAGV